MHIKIIAVGRLREKYWADAMAEYTKRIGRFASVEVLEVADKKIPDNAGEKQCEQLLRAEGEGILAKIVPSQFVIALCVESQQLTSEQFAERLSECALKGNSTVVFVIGGSLGLSEEVKRRADLKLGFSKMTFPHQLMRVVLAEQVYRAFKILGNETYHK